MSTRQERAELRRLADELAKPREACSIGGPAYGQHPCMKVPCWAVDAARTAVPALLDEVERLESEVALQRNTLAAQRSALQAVRDLRDDRDRALELLGLTREDAERVDASLRAVAARLKP